ncbi:hypothetical protein BMS3Bbin12_01735 [bacterium BMS3Bbin12]|nr:hypothetical protein BMS3Bbin12_01735 [bacterium BMS3Bbin12]
MGALKSLVNCLQSDCRLAPADVRRIFQAAFHAPNLERMPGREANLLTVYGQYELNVRHDFVSGARLFRRAVTVAPGDAQYRINLINLLLVMGKVPAASRELAALRALNRFGTLTDVIAPVARDVERARRAETGRKRIAPPTRSP